MFIGQIVDHSAGPKNATPNAEYSSPGQNPKQGDNTGGFIVGEAKYEVF